MGQCVSRTGGGGDGDGKNNTSPASSSKPEPRCLASGCLRTCDPSSRSRYCTQHAQLCRRQGCSKLRYRKGPYCQEHLRELFPLPPAHFSRFTSLTSGGRYVSCV